MGRNSNTFSKDFKAAKANKTLSKPRDIDYTSKMGYQDGSPFSNRPYIDINTPSGYIDMSNTGIPLFANGQYLPPYSGMHYMGTPVVREIPMAQYYPFGGQYSKTHTHMQIGGSYTPTPVLNMTPQMQQMAFTPTTQKEVGDWVKRHGSGRLEESMSPLDFLGPAEIKAGMNMFRTGAKAGAKALPKAAKEISEHVNLPLKNIKDFPAANDKYFEILNEQQRQQEWADIVNEIRDSYYYDPFPDGILPKPMPDPHPVFDRSILTGLPTSQQGFKTIDQAKDFFGNNDFGNLDDQYLKKLLGTDPSAFEDNIGDLIRTGNRKKALNELNRAYNNIQNVTNNFANFDPTRLRYGVFNRNPKSLVNKSGLSKEDILKKASPKDKDVISKMSEEEFANTVLKPTGEIAPYKPGTELEQMTYDLGNRRLKLKDAIEMSEKEYADAFNENLDLLNDIIAQKNKSGVEYRVKGLDESGRLTFHTPKQSIPVKLTDKEKANVEWFNRDPKDFLINKAGLKQEGNKWKMSDEAGGDVFNSIEEAIEFTKGEMKPLIEPKIISGESTWGVKLNPGQWKGNVEDIANTEYFRSIPGLEMSNTTQGVFADNVPRKGTKAYESINEYLKRLDLGRVKPGFNSQTEYSRGAWENAIKSGKAFGYYNNPSVVYGTMRSALPYLGAGYLGYEGLNNPSDEYKRGGVNPLMKARSKRDTTNKNIQSSVNKLFLRNPDLFGPGGKNIYDPETNKKLNTMSTKKKYGGDSGAPHNGQPTANEFFSRGWIPPGPVGFYKLGGQSTDEIAFPQQVPANYFFAGVPWQNDLGHFAYGGGLPGGANEGMPCMECGGYMQDGGEQYGDYMAMGGIPQQYGGVNDGTMGTFKEGGNWIQKATASIKRRGTEGKCTGSKFGGPGCPPGSKAYNLAKTFRAMAKKAYGGTTDGVDQDDYIASRANDFNNVVRMNYGMAEADNQMKRLDQEQQALAQQAAMYAMPQAQYGMSYNPQMAQATANYNQAQGMLDQWNQQGKDSRNQFFGALGQGADNAYNRNSYIKWDLKKSPDADLGKAIRAVQDVHTKYEPGGEASSRDAYEKAKADYLRGFDDMYYSGAVNTANTNLPWMQPRNYMRYSMTPQYEASRDSDSDYYMRYGMTPQYKAWRDSYSGGDGNMVCTEHGCFPANHDPRIHQYPGYYQETPFYQTSANGQTYYDYGNPNSWRNINQYPGGTGGSWNTPGWGGPNPFYNQMFGNPNMYTTLGDVDVKRGLFGSIKNPKRVKMHFNTYFNPTTGRMESAPAADQSSTASTTSATPATTTPAATSTADNKSKLNPMQQKALDDVNKFIIKTNLYNDVQKGFDNPSELTEDQIADLRGSVTPNTINPALERELNPADPMMPMQARRINSGMPTPASRSVSAPTLDQAAEWMSNARNYYGNQMGQNTGVFNMPGAGLPGAVQSQESSDAYRKPIVARDRAKAAAERDLNINSTVPAPAKVYPPGVSTDRQKWLYDTYGQDRFSGITPGMAYGGYLPMAQNGVNNTDPNAIPAMSPMKPRTIGLPPQQPQATPALQASPMTPVGGWDLSKEKKTPWSGEDIYGVISGAIGMGTNALLGNERAGMEDYIDRQTMADNLFSAANPYRGDITQTGAGYGSQFGSLNQTPPGAYTKSGGYVYANGGAYETGVPMELTDEEIQAIMAAGGTVRYI